MPDYRNGKSGVKLMQPEALEYIRRLEEDSGAEFMSAFCETWHPITQYFAFRHLGWKLAGIFPGQATRHCGKNREYRGCLVHLYKLVGEGEEFATRPDEWQLIPEARKLWAVLEEINKASDDAGLRAHAAQRHRKERSLAGQQARRNWSGQKRAVRARSGQATGSS